MIKEFQYMLLFLVSVFISSVSQIILKKSADTEYANKIKEYLNIRVIGAYGCFFGATVMTTLAYKGVPLSVGPLLEATGYIWVIILGYIFLKEKITRRKILGMLMICIGIFVTCLL